MEGFQGPLLSFYMTVKNGLPFLVDAVKSIQNQTYENIEVVIVDDGSNDGSVDYLEALEKSDSRFRVIVTEGVGRGKALNIALNATSGFYVANLDADDCSHPQRAEIQIGIMEESSKVFLSAQSDILFDDNAPSWRPLESFRRLRLKNVTQVVLKNNPINHSSVMIRRDVILGVGGYNEKRSSQLDYDLWIRLVASGVELYKVEQSLVCKRIHSRQSFENKKRLKYLYSSVCLQWRGISIIGGSSLHYIYPIARFLYGALPQRLRSRIRS